jgi:DNA-binding NarL/FixJ family response regulator
MNTPVSVALVEDDPLHRERFRDNLAADSRLALIGEYSSVSDALKALGKTHLDVLLVDLDLPDGTGFDVISHARRVSPDTEIMVVSVFGGEANLLRAIEVGATGYLLKDTLSADFNAAIHALRAGESPISPPLARLLLRKHQPAPALIATTPDPVLSRREVEILDLVAVGVSFAEIADRLFVSPHTVKTHVKNIYRKLEAHSSTHAVYLARQRGLIPL